MSLSKPALAMLDCLAAIGGGEVAEKFIREKTKISHGSFVAARRELVERGFIRYEPQGGNHSPIYVLLSGSETKAARMPQNDHKVREEENLLEELPSMPRVTGCFSDMDAWTDELMERVGECLDIQESLLTPGEFTVFSHEFCQYACYHVVDVNGMIEVI